MAMQYILHIKELYQDILNSVFLKPPGYIKLFSEKVNTTLSKKKRSYQTHYHLLSQAKHGFGLSFTSSTLFHMPKITCYGLVCSFTLSTTICFLPPNYNLSRSTRKAVNCILQYGYGIWNKRKSGLVYKMDVVCTYFGLVSRFD